ncbi:transcription termination/antitermination protein NusG [Anaerocolumna cellulosilytica]|uniref:Transcription termination/antitermination protein NusG n=1 Tax=Anaerocolumna cellulosilytica TaxID=433286 RepID=A0A6S6RAA3_9FIRM|nr:antiterminator LoaP [Anaerocolumna cellulosilytica]MBB5194972.1 transcriptional antiterminator NusG [Anaerocolumna cellulosilytica]BCJ96192.1 transcription termination/antitermination protein NusG [Anaerocolumna cellulosilytica]
MKNWYILYVRTGCEEKIQKILQKRLNNEYFLPFIPMKKVVFKQKGITYIEKKSCFPGYVFIQSKYEENEFIKLVFPIMQCIEDVYLFLHYENKYDIRLREEERVYLNKIMGSDYCIEHSVGYIEGDKIRVVSGVLMGMESKIKKINRHKREAIIEVFMMGDNRRLSVALEVLEKI